MKNIPFKNIKAKNSRVLALAILAACTLSQCEVEDPVKEDTPELITRATLTFTPDNGDPLIVTATDPDGEGVKDITMDKPIELEAGKTYALSISLVNELADPTSPDYNVDMEVNEQADEHLFFFGWTGNVFSDPAGDGNIDRRDDDVNYDDHDVNSLPLGLHTTWTAGTPSAGTFSVILKHQPGLKSATSTSADGETDLDVVFDISVK